MTWTTLSKEPKKARAPRLSYLHCLWWYLKSRYTESGVLTDLERLIDVSLDLLTLIEGEAHWRKHIGWLCSDYMDKYLATSQVEDLEEAIRFSRRLFPKFPPKSDSDAVNLYHLSKALRYMHHKPGDLSHLEESIEVES